MTSKPTARTLHDCIGQENIQETIRVLVEARWDGVSQLDDEEDETNATSSFSCHPLLDAVAMNALSILRALLLDDATKTRLNVNVNARAPYPGQSSRGKDENDDDDNNKRPLSALHLACLEGNLPALEILLVAGADPNLRLIHDEGFTTPLWCLTKHRNVLLPRNPQDRFRVIALQLNGGASEINTCNAACRRMLLEFGANPQVMDAQGKSLLLKDCHDGWMQGVALLLKYGAHRNVSYPEYGPLDVAAMKLNADLCDLLGRYHVKFTFVDNNLPIPLQYAFRRRSRLARRFLATIQSIMPLLPGNSNAYDSHGQTLLHLLARKLKQDDYEDLTEATLFQMVETIVCQHGDSNRGQVVDAPTRELAQTPLMEACKADNHVMVRVLLRHGADAQNARDVHGRNSLFYARDTETIELLVGAGALLEEKDRYGRTPLLECIAHHKARVEYLLDSGASEQARDNHGWTSLHHAVFQGDADIVQMIVEAWPASVTARDDHGRTPLHLFGIMLATTESVPYTSRPLESIGDYADFIDRLLRVTDKVINNFDGYEVLDANELDVLDLLFVNSADPIASDNHGNLPFFFGARMCWDSSAVFHMVRQAALAGLLG